MRLQARYQTWSPPRNYKAYHTSTWNWIELNGPVEPHSRKCESLPLMCLKYSIGSLKTHSKDAIYHMLDKALKFSATKMQKTIKRTLIGL